MGETMSDENIQADNRRQRVQRLKKAIVLTLVISITIPIILCVVLLVGTIRLTEYTQALSEQVERLTWTVEEQQEKLEDLKIQLNNLQASEVQNGFGNTANGEAQNPITGQVLEREEQSVPGGESEQLSQDAPQAVVEETAEASRRVYLTFDDGPSIYTRDILDVLKRYDVKATFFVVGKESATDKELLRQIVEEGHTLGMHSYSHRYSQIYASVENFAKDFEKLQDYLYETTGVLSMVYRFPGGSSNTVSDVPMQEFAQYLDGLDIQFYDWNVSSRDSDGRMLSVEELVENSTGKLENYADAVILFHDSADKRTTVEALPIIIENILAMEDTVIVPITEETEPVQHIEWSSERETAAQKGMED